MHNPCNRTLSYMHYNGKSLLRSFHVRSAELNKACHFKLHTQHESDQQKQRLLHIILDNCPHKYILNYFFLTGNIGSRGYNPTATSIRHLDSRDNKLEDVANVKHFTNNQTAIAEHRKITHQIRNAFDKLWITA